MEKIKQLREQTGAAVVDCKKALEESGNDIEKAVEILRKKGISKATKRADKEATEGTIAVVTNKSDNQGYILKINSETDFLARNEQFKEMISNIMETIKQNNPLNLEELKNLSIEEGTVGEKVDNLSGVMKEKITLTKFETLQASTVGAYFHMNGTIGVLVGLNKEGKQKLAKDIAMHIAASNPRYISPQDVDPKELEKEKDIHREQLKQENKPKEIIEKIIEGKINKFYEENCLLKQEFIKDEDKKVEEFLGDTEIKTFVRYSL